MTLGVGMTMSAGVTNRAGMTEPGRSEMTRYAGDGGGPS